MTPRTGQPTVVVAAPDDVAGVAADHILRVLGAAIEARGVAHWATTGGSNPADIYHAMRGTARRDAIDWDAVHVWWGDDRFVPRDHPLSNVKALDEILLDETHGIHIPPEHLHPFRCGEVIGRGGDAARCAAELEDELRSVGPEMADAWPSFDLVFLGMGGDGHLLSVFPGSAALDAVDWAMAIPAPTHIEPRVERLTLNPAVVTSARHVLVVVVGADKAATVADVFGPERDARRWPAQLARHDRATWILDAAAAGDLPDR
jgi:6-phosphogluconolactonase